MLKIEIDKGSGFCFGVTTAIQKAEVNTTFGNGSNYLRFSVGARTEMSGYARINSVNIQYR